MYITAYVTQKKMRWAELYGANFTMDYVNDLRRKIERCHRVQPRNLFLARKYLGFACNSIDYIHGKLCDFP